MKGIEVISHLQITISDNENETHWSAKPTLDASLRGYIEHMLRCSLYAHTTDITHM